MWTKRRSNNTQNRSSDDHRSPFERDNTRVIHSAAFRRLQRKTQILGTTGGDFHRTRLTHSLEVASIAKSLVRNLKKRAGALDILPSDDLISAISLLHDMGHPPFGHGGEVALNYAMRENGGFEGNGQTLRLVTCIENTYGEHGLDLTRRTLMGILKYPGSFSSLNKTAKPSSHSFPIRINDWLPPKCYLDSETDLIDWILSPLDQADRALFESIHPPKEETHGQTQYRSLDCSLMNIADDIAYGVHDFEDAVHLKLIERDNIATSHFIECYDRANQEKHLPPHEKLLEALFHTDNSARKNAIGALVNYFVTQTKIQNIKIFKSPLLSYNATLSDDARALLSSFKDIIYHQVIDSPEARSIEYGGQTVVLKLFEAIHSNPLALLTLDSRKKYQKAKTALEAQRQICDHIANMTDEYAYRMHERLFGFNTRTRFERL